MRKTKKPFVKPFRFRFINVMQRDFLEPIETEEQVQVSEGPRHNVHVGAALDSADETGETREEPTKKELEPSFGKPDIWCSDDQLAAGHQMLMCCFEEEIRIAEMLDALATHDRFIKPQVVGKAHIEIYITKHAICCGRGGEQIEAIYPCFKTKKALQPSAT